MSPAVKKFLEKHWYAGVLALVCGAVMLSPQIVFIVSSGPAYQGIYMMNSDAEPHYVARMEEFYDSKAVGNAYFSPENSPVPDTLYTFSESSLAIPGYITGISVPTLNLIYKFLLPALVFLLAYFLLYRLTARRLWSLAGASLILMGNVLLSLPDIMNLIHLREAYSQFSLFSRPVNPEFSSLIFFGYLHLLLSAFRSPKNNLWFLWLGLLFGLSFYAYFYSWTCILAINFSLIILVVWKKEYQMFSAKLGCATLGGVLIGARAVHELLAVRNSLLLSGLGDMYAITSHHPVISGAGLIISLVFVGHICHSYYRKKMHVSREDIFIAALLVTALLDVNQQIVTGISMQTGHYHWYFNTPIFMMTIAYLCSFYGRQLQFKKIEMSRYENGVAIFLIGISIISALWLQYSSYENDHDAVLAEQGYGTVFKWLNANVPYNSVIMVSEPIADIVPAYTSLNVLYSDYGTYYLLSPERRAYGNAQALADLQTHQKRPFELDYVLWNSAADPSWHMNTLTNMKLVETVGSLGVYKVTDL